MIKTSVSFPAVVFVLPEVKKKLDVWSLKAKGEVSCLGKIKKLEKGNFLVYEVIMFEQKCNPSDTIIDQSKVGDYIEDTILAGEDPSNLKFWWHSHADMDPFWSATDDGTIHRLFSEWGISVVTNRLGIDICRIDSYVPIHTVAYNIPFRVYLEPDEELERDLINEMEEKVHFEEPKPVKSGFRYPTITNEDYPHEGIPFNFDELPISQFTEGVNNGFLKADGVNKP